MNLWIVAVCISYGMLAVCLVGDLAKKVAAKFKLRMSVCWKISFVSFKILLLADRIFESAEKLAARITAI